jgi:hypothetical protein
MAEPITTDEYLKATLTRLEHAYHAMSSTFGPPAVKQITTRHISGIAFRYRQESDSLLCFLKGVKLISTLNGALVLLSQGYVQEISALIRIADDCCADILFMSRPMNGDEPSADQSRFFEEFYQEEFDDPKYPLGSNKKRDVVPRKSVFTGFAQLAGEHLNPSDAQSVMTTIHKAFSRYIHGAYPHIMELYGGRPSRLHFHMSGMSNTSKVAEARAQLIAEIYRAIMASELVSRKLGLEAERKSVRELLTEYETRLGVKPTRSPGAAIREVKKK